jgi:DNA-binding SARP family transcriptional activator
LARAKLIAGDGRGVLEVAERGSDLDELNETFVRLALEGEGMLGLRDALADRYEQFRQLLDDRLGLEPERETRMLYLRLLGGAEKSEPTSF